MDRTTSLRLFLAALSLWSAQISNPPPTLAAVLAEVTAGLKYFKDLETQTAYGADIMWGVHHWPVLLDGFACRASGDRRGDLEDLFKARSYEAGLGLAKVWNVGAFHPRVSFGASRVWRRTRRIEESRETAFEEKASRLWLSGGGLISMGFGTYFGANVRFSELRNMYPSLGGTHVGFAVGWGSVEGW